MSALPKIAIALPLMVCWMLLWSAAPARAENLELPPAAKAGLDLLHAGQPERAIKEFRQIQVAAPDDPLGYLLEADARWWQMYCQSCQIKWNLIDAWQRPRVPSDDLLLAATDKAKSLADAQIAKKDSAVMELYAGSALLLRASVLALHDDRRPAARAAVEMRSRMLRCLALDPQMADAYTVLGLYNYYVDTLSTLAKVLRFFMGIPGGDKHEGERQLRIAIRQGVLTPVEASLYLSKNLRNYDRDYAGAIAVITPMVDKYPQNPVFPLLRGDMQAKLGHMELALADFRAAAQMPGYDASCAERVRALTRQASAALGVEGKGSSPQ